METPSASHGEDQPNPLVGPWVFSGAAGGIEDFVAKGGLLSDLKLPNDSQAVFLQKTGSVSQVISGLTAGKTYTVKFLAAEHSSDVEPWEVTVEGAPVADFHPKSGESGFVSHAVDFTATAPTETLAFVGANSAGGSNAVAIDSVQVAAASSATVVNLTVEHLTNPLGIDVVQPRFSWMLSEGGRGHAQTGYQILVASSLANLTAGTGDLWNSGTITSSQSVLVPYAGQTLTSGEACYWEVRVVDEQGNLSAWSSPATFSIGLLTSSAWTGFWIGMNENTSTTPAPPSPMLRKTFTIAKPVARATAYICGLGYYELQLNGSKVGTNVLDPSYTRYDFHEYYTTYDLTNSLVQGANAVGVQLANGFYNQWAVDEWNTFNAPWRALPEMIVQIAVQYTDGTSSTIVSDTSWKTSTGPLVLDTTRLGEVYDARLEQAGWSTATFNDSAWTSAVARNGPSSNLLAPDAEPVTVLKNVSPVQILLVSGKPGVYTFDFGQNLSGWGQLTVSGPAGTSVNMVYGELLNSDNSVNQSNINGLVCINQSANLKPYFQADTYILKGVGTEVYAPRFTYHGFRYAEVSGLPSAPTTNTLVAQVVGTAFNQGGSFQSSSSLINQIESNAIWSYQSNFVGIPTDCPHREKNGWTGDAQLAAEMGLTHFDSAAAYARWMKEFAPAQLSTGELFGVLPNANWGPGSGPAWEGAVQLVPWYVYQHTGDTSILTNNYSAMKAYIKYAKSQATGNIVSYGLADPSPASTQTPANVTDTSYYYQITQIVAQVATLMGNTADATTYNTLAAQIKTSFNSTFYNASTAQYSGGTQTAQACALNQGLATANPSGVAQALATTVQQNNNRIDTGAVGAKALLRALCDNGHSDTAMALALQTSSPSWGNQVLEGATTLWETWIGTGGFDSHNHIFYGDVSAWFMEYLAGIRPGSPGYQSVIIKPEITGALASAQATHNSPYGTISNSWQMTGQNIAMSVTIPPNSTGVVYLPTLGTPAANLVVQESGATIWTGGGTTGSDTGVTYKDAEGSGDQTYSVWNVTSGSYQFNWTILPTPNALIAHAGYESVLLTWAPPGATSYNVKRSTVSGGPYTVIASGVTGATYADTTVTNGVTYYYVVSAVNSGVEGSNSTQVSAVPSQNLLNPSFETPVVSTYTYNVVGASWNFSGSSPNGSGILANGSAFSNPKAPAGTQAAFVEEFGTMSQTLYGLTPGNPYTITYFAAQRPGSSESWNVMMDNTIIQTNSPGSTSYTKYAATFTATATAQTLSFVGTDLAGGDNTVFIDNVSMSSEADAAVGTPSLVSAASIQSHAGTNYPIALSLTGTPGVECRQINETLRLVYTFDRAVVSGDADVIDGDGDVENVSFNGDTMTVDVTGVTNAQEITVQVSNLNGTAGSGSVTLGVLLGDINGDGAVNAQDVTIDRNAVESVAGTSGFNPNTDINLDGAVNAQDVTIVRNAVESSIPDF
jgi:alpha-L-rhamnosidase